MEASGPLTTRRLCHLKALKVKIRIIQATTANAAGEVGLLDFNSWPLFRNQATVCVFIWDSSWIQCYCKHTVYLLSYLISSFNHSNHLKDCRLHGINTMAISHDLVIISVCITQKQHTEGSPEWFLAPNLMLFPPNFLLNDTTRFHCLIVGVLVILDTEEKSAHLT